MTRARQCSSGGAPRSSSRRARGLVRRIPYPARRRFRRAGRRGRHPARAQRRGQDDDVEIDHGHRRQAQGLGALRGHARPSASPPTASPALGVALCPEERGIFASLNVEENLMLPPRIAKTGGLGLERIFTLFPNLKERLAQRRRQALGRRAADAGDRPHPAHRRALPDARRADRGPCAGHHPADRPHDRRAASTRASRSCSSSRISVSPRPSPTATT